MEQKNSYFPLRSQVSAILFHTNCASIQIVDFEIVTFVFKFDFCKFEWNLIFFSKSLQICVALFEFNLFKNRQTNAMLIHVKLEFWTFVNKKIEFPLANIVAIMCTNTTKNYL